MEALKLEPSEHRQKFFEDGFFVLSGEYDQNEIGILSRSLDRIEDKAKQLKEPTTINDSLFVVENEAIQRVVWCPGDDPSILIPSRKPSTLAIVRELLNSDACDHIICQAHFKLPGDNVKFDWHQDSQHRNFGTTLWNDLNQTGSFVQSLIAIDPMHETNGPIQFLKGSVELGHLGLHDGYALQPLFDRYELVTLTMEPGDIAFFHPYVIHGSSANQSEQKRRVLINGFAYPGSNQYKYPGCGVGERISLLSNFLSK